MLKLKSTEEITFWKKMFEAYVLASKPWSMKKDDGGIIVSVSDSPTDLADNAVIALRKRIGAQDKSGERL